MSDELTPAPRIDGEFWVIDDRRFPRLRGAEDPVVEDTPAENAAPVDGTPAPQPEESEYTPERARGLHAELTKVQQQQADQARLLDRARLGDVEAARELGFEFASDEEDPDLGQNDEEVTYGEAETADPVARQWIEQQQVKENLALFNSHLDRLAGSPDVLDDWDRQALLNASIASGFNEQATEAAFKQWQERNDTREKAQFEKWKKSKTASHVAPGGTGVTQEDLPLDATHAQRVAFMNERLQLANEQ